MHRIARAILAIVGLFAVGVVGTLVVKSRTARVEQTGPAASNADLTVKHVQIEEEADGVRWRLRAEQAATFQKEDRTTLRKIAVHVFERDRAWTMVGDEGDLFEKARRVELRGNVVLTSDDGVRLETSLVRWSGGEKRLWTDAPVTLSRDRTVIRGRALEIRMGEEVTTLAGRVHATFVEPRPQ